MPRSNLRPFGFLSVLALLMAGCAAEKPRLPANPRVVNSVAAVRLDPAAALAMLNAYRTSHGLTSVRLDPALTAMAQREANANAALGSLSHDAGGSFASRLTAAGLDTARARENLGGGYMSTEEAFAGWRASPDHNVNLLMPEARRFGIAIAKDAASPYRVYWAMVVAADPERRSDAPSTTLIAPGFGPVRAP